MESNKIYLTEVQRSELEQFTKTGVHSARQIIRAKTILALDRTNKQDKLRVGRICEQVGISRQTLYNTQDAFLKAESIESFLTRKKRETPPVPPKVTGDVEAHIIALACSEPPEGHARWTLYLLANRIVELGILDSVTDMTVHRVLKKRNLSLI